MEKEDMENLLGELLGVHSTLVHEFSKKIINNRNRTEKEIREIFEFLKNFGFKIKTIAKHAQLLSSDIETTNEILSFLYEKECSSEQILQNVRLLSRNIHTLKRNWEFLEYNLKFSLAKIRTECLRLLTYTQETLQYNWDNLRALKLSPKKIRAHPRLLTRNPRVLRLNYKFLEFLGIKPDKININCNLLLSDLNTLKDNFEFLRDLGIQPETIFKFTQ